MKTSHTPGPWKARIYPYGDHHQVSNKSGQMFIADVLKLDADEQTEANAKLIAAAPDLLEALKDIIHANDTGMGKSAVRLRIDIAREVIKKATE